MSVYKVIELVGTSPESWEKAAQEAIETAAHTVRDLRIAEVTKLDAVVDDDDPARAVDVGMSVDLARASMSRPPGMAEAVGALDRRADQALLQGGDLAPDPAKTEASAAGDGHAGRVVSAVFELF